MTMLNLPRYRCESSNAAHEAVLAKFDERGIVELLGLNCIEVYRVGPF